MKRLLSALALCAILSSPAFAEEAAGDWSGMLMGQLHVRLHLDKAADGHYSGEIISVDQGNAHLPLTDIATDGAKLSFAIPVVHGAYTAIWDEAEKAWVGTWSQGAGVPLSFTRATTADLAAPKRPQEAAIAAGPRPYSARDVSFAGGASGVNLAGTFSVPDGKGPFPAVVLIAGSGPENRDEEVMGHKVFLVLADALNRAGIAVLRYDKRGIAGSSGDARTATTQDYIGDAEAAVAWLKAQPEVALKHIGVIGHSEGGLIAPAVAVADPSVAFVVMLAGPGVRGDALLTTQTAAIGKASGMSDAQLAAGRQINTTLYAAVLSAATPEAAKANVQAALQPYVASGELSADRAALITTQTSLPWMVSFLRYDPAPVLQKLRVPVLAINGGRDLQVDAQQNLPAIKAALANDKDVTTLELPGLNHLLQKADTGSLAEYAQIEETIDPVALKAITAWVVAQAR